MKILQGILLESKEYYLDAKKKVEEKLVRLPKGSIKERLIAGKKYYYLQQRIKQKVVHKYLGKSKPQAILAQLKERKALKFGLSKINTALKILKRAEGRKHD